MRITETALSLNVADPAASARFMIEHFGFVQTMGAEGFASLTRADAGMNLVYLVVGMPTLPTDQRDVRAQGQIIAFVVDDLEGELARLEREGVSPTMPLTVEEWGERAFQVRDPNGIIIQLVDWNGPVAEQFVAVGGAG